MSRGPEVRLRRRSLANLSCMGHCAPTVMQTLLEDAAVDAPWLVTSCGGLPGGMGNCGGECGRVTAPLMPGVVALGDALGTIEWSRLRVLRMIGLMAIGGDAFSDEYNEFNKTMNLGHRLARWFEAEFGSTQCRALTQCELSTAAGVSRYVERDTIPRCRAITERVAQEVDRLIAQRS